MPTQLQIDGPKSFLQNCKPSLISINQPHVYNNDCPSWYLMQDYLVGLQCVSVVVHMYVCTFDDHSFQQWDKRYLHQSIIL